MRQPPRLLQQLFLLIAPLLLGGCMGGSLGQQVARSIMMQAADKVTWQAIEVQRRKDEEQARTLTFKDTTPDKYWAAFATAQFAETSAQPAPASQQPPVQAATATINRLVPVEIWGFVVGQEKHAVLERLRQNGSDVVPTRSEWGKWQLATGSLAGQSEVPLYFLVPPDFGRINSGDRAIVEIAGVGGLHIARYRGD